MKYVYSFLLAVLLAGAGTNSAEAFKFEDARVIKLTEQTALFSISYSARFREYVTYHPLSVSLAKGLKIFENNTTFVSVNGADNIVSFNGFVESSAPVVNRKYRVPVNDDEILTVHTLVTVAEGESIEDVSVGLREIPVNAVAPGESTRYFNLTGVAVETATTPTVSEYLSQ